MNLLASCRCPRRGLYLARKGGSCILEGSPPPAAQVDEPPPTIFDQAAERYDRARPKYPTELFDDLSTIGGLAAGARVLEIGPGTGQATVPLAVRDYEVVAVEIGAELAAVARQNLAPHWDAVVVNSSFESWQLPEKPFDLVLAATAFHWVDPRVRVPKAVDALRPGGWLALVDTHHVAGGTEEFFVEVQDCYERWDPSTQPSLRLPRSDDVPRESAEIDASGRFDAVEFRRYEFEVIYATAEYLDVLLTYSGHLALPDGQRWGLLDCIAGLLESRYGGSIVKRYMVELRMARRRN